MLTSTTRGGGYRLLSASPSRTPLSARRGTAPAPDLHAQSRVEVVDDDRTPDTARSDRSRRHCHQPFATWTLPAEFGGLALTGTSVMALAGTPSGRDARTATEDGGGTPCP